MLLGAPGIAGLDGKFSMGAVSITVVPLMYSGMVGNRTALAGTTSPVHLITSGREHNGEKVREHSRGIYIHNTTHCSVPLSATHAGVI